MYSAFGLSNLNMYVLLAGVFIATLFLLKGLWQFYKRFRFLNNLLISAKTLEGAEVGDYVRVDGAVTHPNTTTPYGKRPCHFYLSIVKAFFKTKRKNSSSSYTTHKPVIYTECSAEREPLLLEQNQQLIHCIFKAKYAYSCHFEHLHKKTKTPPIQGAEPTKKSKYQSYSIEEFWLPEGQPMSVFGYVVDINKTSIVVSCDSEKSLPLILSGQPLTQLVKFGKMGVAKLKSLFFWVVTILVGGLAFANPFWGIEFSSVLILFALFIVNLHKNKMLKDYALLEKVRV